MPDSVSKCLPGRLWMAIRRGYAMAEAFLVDYYRLCSRVEGRPIMEKARAVRLQAGELLCLKRDSGVREIEVVCGILWVTETPAREDILLHPGARFRCSRRWLVVAQAIRESEIVLRRGG